MTQRRNCQTFTAEVNGHEYTFNAYTTSTRNGFCHTICTFVFDGEFRNLTDTKVSYWNRTWERFEYESALSRAIEKCPKADQKALRDILIEHKAKKKHEECEAFLKSFESADNKLSDKNKEILRNSPQIQTQEQAEGVLSVMHMMNAVDAILK